MPNGMTLTQNYEPQRDLLTQMSYHRGNTLVTQRSYTYDALGRPLTRGTSRNRQTINDSFGYNNRSELITATVNGTAYEYTYDNIGNRTTATEGENITAYAANELNQYTAVGAFTPTFDADGNQTLIKTTTGIWSVEYNAENRPIRFTGENGATLIECTYDSMGRRATKKVTVNGAVTLHRRYIYRGYLQIAACDLTRTDHPCLWHLTWDPTQTIATRPLALRKDGTWYTYGWDLTKNICEIYGPAGYIRTAYTYAPYGEVTSEGDVTQPIQWSSEYNDTELGLIYYNYRHYNLVDGRWVGRDLSLDAENSNLYLYASNAPVHMYDVWGNFAAAATVTTAGLVISAPVLVGALVAAAVVGAVVYVATKKCPACPLPTQKPGSRLDCVPPSRPHYPCKGNHLHSWVFVMHQNPITCQCYEKKEETVTCLN